METVSTGRSSSGAVQVSCAAAESSDNDNNEQPQSPHLALAWPKYKHCRDPQTGEEAVYVLLEKPGHRHHHLRKTDTWKICRQLLDLSSISLFVASNLLAFTVGLLVGRQGTDYY